MSAPVMVAARFAADVQLALAAELEGVVQVLQGGDGVDRVLPDVVVRCRALGTEYSVRADGRYGVRCELSTAVRVSATAPNADAEVRALAEAVRAAVEENAGFAAAIAAAGWSFVRLESTGEAQENGDGLRIVAPEWVAVLLE